MHGRGYKLADNQYNCVGKFVASGVVICMMRHLNNLDTDQLSKCNYSVTDIVNYKPLF